MSGYLFSLNVLDVGAEVVEHVIHNRLIFVDLFIHIVLKVSDYLQHFVVDGLGLGLGHGLGLVLGLGYEFMST